MINNKNSLQIGFKIQPLILSGGSGTRLWPLSRKSFPKQYLYLNKKSEFSPLQQTQKRLLGLKDLEAPIIICNEDQRFIAAEQMREINTKPKSIILEPEGRNTAPAIAIGALKSIEEGIDPILLILSSDHEIKDSKKFRKIIETALVDVQKERLVIFGIKPNKPETGYGYIEAKSMINLEEITSVPVKSFIEKPDEEKAKKLIKDKRYLWNSGIFLCRASLMINELERYEPELLSLCKKAINKTRDIDFQRLEIKYFKKCPNISIDYAVMEKTQKAYVLPLDIGWSDVGNWKTLWEIENKDSNGNIIEGDIKTKSAKNCYLKSENKLLVAIGIEDLIVVQTDDATLVCNRKDHQKIKNIVNKLILDKRTEGYTHSKVFRPWGYFNSIKKGFNWQVKEIFVNPKSALSLQKHNYRSEHWIILKGKAIVEINESKIELLANQSAYIPIGAKHRLSNAQNTPLILIEVQCGSYLGEDDIFRYEDNYGRNIIQ